MSDNANECFRKDNTTAFHTCFIGAQCRTPKDLTDGVPGSFKFIQNQQECTDSHG